MPFYLQNKYLAINNLHIFKYDKEKMPEMPAVWVVVDKKDSPIASRIIGDYLVAETTADNFTIRIGEAYVCVRKKK